MDRITRLLPWLATREGRREGAPLPDGGTKSPSTPDGEDEPRTAGADPADSGGTASGTVGRHTTDEAALEALAENLSAVAEGDLTVRMDEGRTDGAAAAVACAFNEMVDAWADTVRNVEGFSHQVRGATESVETNTEEATEASRRVSREVEEISEEATRQHDHIREISDEMRNLSAATEEVAATADDLEAATTEATERGDRVGESAGEAVEVLDDIDERMVEAVDHVEDLQSRVAEIEEVVEFIEEVASQTHVLSLNASIEAARASEDGAGFAVVADEVKELAGETQTATEEITESIESIRDQTELTVSEMRDTRARVASGTETITDALDAVSDLVDDLERANSSIEELSDATDSQASASQEVVGMLDEVREISEQTTATADGVAETARQQSTMLVEASTSVGTLTDRAEGLSSTLSEVAVGSTSAAADDSVVRFWHAMGGSKGLLLEELAEEFEEETGIPVELSPKGSYRGTHKATLSAVEAGDPPTIAQLFEIGTSRALDSGGFRPVSELLSSDVVDSLLDPVANYYRHDGQLYSLPFNSSNPVLYINRDAFREAGLDPSNPPETLSEVAAASERLVDAGVVETGATWANYSWFVEQWFAEAGEPLVDQENGRSGTPTAANLSGDFGKRLFTQWSTMEADGIYHNPGVEARGEARSYFLEGRSAMLIDSTSKSSAVIEGGEENGFDVETGYFPVLDDRNGVVVGGASLWVPSDVPRAEQEAAGEFLAWLAQPEQQARWHRNTGYFPVSEGAVRRLDRDGWFDENPAYETAVRQLMETTDSPATRGARIGPFNTIRTLVEETYVDVTRGRDVDAALESLDEQVETQLREYAGGL